MGVGTQTGQWQLPWNTCHWEVFRMCCNKTNCHPMVVFQCFLTSQKPWLTSTPFPSSIVTSSLEMCLCVPLTLPFIPWQSLSPFSFLSSSTRRQKVEREWNASQHTTHRITDFGEARTVESMEASMTMTSGVGTPFFMAPEMATGTKHYTGAVDVYSFAIMAAQVLSGRLVYDSSDSFDTSYGLCFHWSFSLIHTRQSPKALCVIGLCFHLALVLCHPLPHTHSVCECSVPRTSTSCEWVFSRDESTGECVLGCQSVLSSLFVFFSPLFHLLILLSCPFHTLHSPFFACTHTSI